MMCVRVVVLLVGMVMGIRQDFLLAPVHGHLIWSAVLLFLFGLYYRLMPAAVRPPVASPLQT